MGRYAKPTVVEIAEGRPGHRAINTREPKPLDRMPKMPAWLNDGAKKEWRRMAPILRRMKVLT